MGPAQKKLSAFGLDALCERILDGRSITAIAQDIGVSVGSVISWIAAEPERSARVREARAATSQFWEEKAEASIESATEPFELARARELAQHYRWRASKIDPKHYGDKQQIEHSGTVSIADALREAKAKRQQGGGAGEG